MTPYPGVELTDVYQVQIDRTTDRQIEKCLDRKIDKETNISKLLTIGNTIEKNIKNLKF